MSFSPPPRRHSSTRSSSKESLINAYEAEEERIINVLSRKLERLREEKIELENALEAESECHVNRLSREISALRLAQQQSTNGSGNVSPVEVRAPLAGSGRNLLEPNTELMLEAMRRENEQMRNRLVDTERDYIRITRLNEIYREELIQHRRRLGLSVDDLIGLTSADPYSQPTHHRAHSTTSPGPASPYLAPHPQAPNAHTASARVPIPRPPSQIHRLSYPHLASPPSTSTTPPSGSSASASLPSPFPFSPPAGASGISAATNLTTPPSAASLMANNGNLFSATAAAFELTYPSVPPPSLSSSFGEPYLADQPLPVPVPVPRPDPDLDLSVSPADPFGYAARSPSLSPRASLHLNRRGSFEHAMREGRRSPSAFRREGAWADGDSPSGGVGGGGASRGRSRVGSVERGGRVAETGQLVRRNGNAGQGATEGTARAENGNVGDREKTNGNGNGT